MIMQLLQNNVHQMEAQRDMIQAMSDILTKLHELEQRDAERIEDLAEDVEGLKERKL